jgi:malate dehydrogenase (quinone)
MIPSFGGKVSDDPEVADRILGETAATLAIAR